VRYAGGMNQRHYLAMMVNGPQGKFYKKTGMHSVTCTVGWHLKGLKKSIAAVSKNWSAHPISSF
jgi:hypothetical protein